MSVNTLCMETLSSPLRMQQHLQVLLIPKIVLVLGDSQLISNAAAPAGIISTDDDCLPPRDTSPHQDSTGTAPSGTPPPAQPPPPPQTRGT